MRTGSDDRGWCSISVVIFSVSISFLDPVLSANLISGAMRKAMVSNLYPFKSMVGLQLMKYSYYLSAYIRANYMREMNHLCNQYIGDLSRIGGKYHRLKAVQALSFIQVS